MQQTGTKVDFSPRNDPSITLSINQELIKISNGTSRVSPGLNQVWNEKYKESTWFVHNILTTAEYELVSEW